jgi:hypothetical protein
MEEMTGNLLQGAVNRINDLFSFCHQFLISTSATNLPEFSSPGSKACTISQIEPPK